MTNYLGRQAGALTDEVISDQALAEFEDLFRTWLADNLDRLEAGSLGNLESLARSVSQWQRLEASRQA